MPERRSRPAVWICVAVLAAGAAACGDEVDPITDARVVDARTDGATIDGPAVDAPAVDAPAVDAPAVDAPAIDAPAIDAAAIDAPAIDAPAIDAPAIDAPAIDAPAIDAAPIDASTAIDAPAIDAALIDASVGIDAAPIDASTAGDGASIDASSVDALTAPTAFSIVPDDGLATVSTTVVLTGSDLVPGTTVTFNGTPGVGCTYQPPTQMTCVAPPGAVGRGAVVLTNTAGTTVQPDAWTYTGVRNETGLPSELDYCNLQFPTTITIPSGADTPLVYGRVFENGITQPAGVPPGLSAEVGVGPAGSNPTTQAGWQFVDASYNLQVGNDDEYMRSLVAPTTPGTYAYTYRFSFDGVYWTYCDADGAGANSGLDFSASQLGLLTITP